MLTETHHVDAQLIASADARKIRQLVERLDNFYDGTARLTRKDQTFDIFGLSGATFGLNVLLVAGLGRWLLDNARHSDFIGPLFMLGVSAAGLLAATVSVVLRVARARVGASHE